MGTTSGSFGADSGNDSFPTRTSPGNASGKLRLNREFNQTSLAAIALIAIVTVRSSASPTILLADGVEPVNKLSFTRAEAAHFSAAKKLDDVSSRSAIDTYFNKLTTVEDAAHKAAEKKSASKQQSLNSYFDSLGQKYHQAAMEHKKARAARHPGKLNTKEKRVKKDIDTDEEAVDAAIDQGVDAGETKVADSASTSLSTNSNKVKIGFYMESMCPGCKYFTTHVLKELMAKPEFVKMVDFTVYPYGNGQLSGTDIQCQHGADECEGNKIIACMQSLYPITEASTGFIPAFICMEGKDGKPKAEAEACAKDNNLDYSKIMQCAKSTDGDTLALSAAQATESLVPAHEYAPWLTMNNAPLRDQAYQLQSVVCDAYKGSDKPAMCNEKQLKTAKQQALSTIHTIGFEVCPRRSGKV